MKWSSTWACLSRYNVVHNPDAEPGSVGPHALLRLHTVRQQVSGQCNFFIELPTHRQKPYELLSETSSVTTLYHSPGRRVCATREVRRCSKRGRTIEACQ